jgi:glutaredoxin 3
MTGAIEKVTNIIKSNKVAVFSKTYCPHCAETISSLTSAGVRFHREDIDKWAPKDMEAVQDWFIQTTGDRIVPLVYFDGKFIGDNYDFQAAYVQTGKIKELAQ